MSRSAEAQAGLEEVAAELGLKPEALAVISRGLAAAKGLEVLLTVLCEATTGKTPMTLTQLMLKKR